MNTTVGATPPDPTRELSANPATREWELYSSIREQYEAGPQHEGLVEHDVTRHEPDTAGLYLTITEGGETARLPLLTPIDRVTGVNQDYFRTRFGEGYGERVQVLSGFLLERTMQSGDSESQAELMDGLQRLATDGTVVFYDFLEGHDNATGLLKTAAEQAGVAVTELPVFDDDSEAAVIHYSGIPEFTEPLGADLSISLQDLFRQDVQSGRFDPRPDNGTVLLLPEALDDTLLDQIWSMYDRQLSLLVENHPMYQRLERGELEAFLTDEASVNIVHFVDGKPVCMLALATDIERQAPWLRANYLEEKYGTKEELMYCPALVADIDQGGHTYSRNIFSRLTDLVTRRGRGVRPYFECTDISATYIPYKVFKPAVDSTGLATIEVAQEAYYGYRMLELHK